MEKKTLQYLNIQTKLESSVTSSFVHDAQWNPSGKEFAIIHGDMPHPKTTIYDLKAIKKFDLMEGEARNKLMFDPTGRILMIGGFGSLPGVIDFWDFSKNEVVKIGHAEAFSSSHQSWSPDGRFFLACVQSPRMKMDNEIKIFSIYGQLLFEEKRNDLFQTEWRSLPTNLFPLQPIQPPNSKKIEIQEKGPEKYRHPNFSANKTPIGGKVAAKPQIGGQVKSGTQTNKLKAKKKPSQPATKTVVIEEIEQPTF